MEKKKFFTEINIMRGIIVIFVIVGHSFNATETPTLYGYLKSLAYSFHMPAFFFVSGFLFENIKLNNTEKLMLIKKKAVRLIVPYMFLTIVSVGLKVIFGVFARNPINFNTLVMDILIGRNNPNGGLWFLYALFAISVIAILFSGIRESWFLGFALMAYLVNTYGVKLYGNILAYIMSYTIYYAIGMLVHKKYGIIKNVIKILIKKVWLLPEVIWMIFAIIVYIDTYLYDIPLCLGVSCFGIISTLIVSIQIDMMNKTNNLFAFIGGWGMDIYMIGYYVQQSIYVILGKILHMDYLVYAWCMLILGLIAPIIISKSVVRRNKILALLILGRK